MGQRMFNMNLDTRTKDNRENGVLLPQCVNCHEVPSAGISGGMKTRQGFLCKACLAERIPVGSGRDEYIDLLKKIKDLIK